MELSFNFYVEGGYIKELLFFICVGFIFFFWFEGGGGYNYVEGYIF